MVAIYLLFGIGIGTINPPITNSAVSGMPISMTGVAASLASVGRQTGTTLGVADGLARYESKRRERAEGIVSRSRKKVEATHASDPAVYQELYAVIKTSSVAETMKAQEELLEEGPFG